MKNNMLNKLKSGYEELEIKPSSGLWDRLDHKLDEKPDIVLKPAYNWWKYAAVVIFLISTGLIVYVNHKNSFNDKEVQYMVKKNIEKTLNPTNTQFKNQSVISNEVITPEKKVKIIAEKNKSNAYQESERKIAQTKISGLKIQEIAIKQSDPIQIRPVKIENTVSGLATVTEGTKTTYISANELLLGREFDKTRKNPDTDAVKFGVFNFDKPKIENITVLGVTVYMDSK